MNLISLKFFIVQGTAFLISRFEAIFLVGSNVILCIKEMNKKIHVSGCTCFSCRRFVFLAE